MFFGLHRDTLRNRERGSVAIIACIFVFFVSTFVSFFFAKAILHNRFVKAHIEECRKEYEREGVLVEAMALLEEKGKGFTARDVPSLFAPSYTFTIADDTITVKTLKSEVLQARVRWEGDRVIVVAAENEFVRPFSQ